VGRRGERKKLSQFGGRAGLRRDPAITAQEKMGIKLTMSGLLATRWLGRETIREGLQGSNSACIHGGRGCCTPRKTRKSLGGERRGGGGDRNGWASSAIPGLISAKEPASSDRLEEKTVRGGLHRQRGERVRGLRRSGQRPPLLFINKEGLRKSTTNRSKS